jgi:hypothetical protein
LSVGDDPWQPLAVQPGVAAVADRQRADRFAHPVGLDRTIVLAASRRSRCPRLGRNARPGKADHLTKIEPRVDAKRGRPGGRQHASVHGHGAALPHCIDLISYWHFQKITALHKLSLLLNVIQQEIRMTKAAMLASTAALALAFTAPIAFARAVTGSPGVLLADHTGRS